MWSWSCQRPWNVTHPSLEVQKYGPNNFLWWSLTCFPADSHLFNRIPNPTHDRPPPSFWSIAPSQGFPGVPESRSGLDIGNRQGPKTPKSRRATLRGAGHSLWVQPDTSWNLLSLIHKRHQPLLQQLLSRLIKEVRITHSCWRWGPTSQRKLLSQHCILIVYYCC